MVFSRNLNKQKRHGFNPKSCTFIYVQVFHLNNWSTTLRDFQPCPLKGFFLALTDVWEFCSATPWITFNSLLDLQTDIQSCSVLNSLLDLQTDIQSCSVKYDFMSSGIIKTP